ncbi:MAG: fibronectin type III domain-containing protein [Bacteroidota bacterium]
MTRFNKNLLYTPIIVVFILLGLYSNSYAADATLSWEKPEDSRITGYNIYYGTSGTDFKANPAQKVDSADQTSCIVSDLEEGMTYDFAATSFDAYGNESDFSETVTHTVENPDTTDTETQTGSSEEPADDEETDTTDEQAGSEDDDTEGTQDTVSGGDDAAQEDENEDEYLYEQGFDFEMEFAEAEITHEWKSIPFEKIFDNPVIVAKPMSLNDSDPAVIRIKNVTWGGFDIRIQEWDYLDGIHASETASYIAMEAGRHELPSGIQVEAGTFETNKTITVNFTKPFNHIPVVVCSVTSENELDAVTGRIYNIGLNRFDFELQEQQANKKGHYTPETISFIAWEPSSDTINGITYIVDTTFEEVTHDLYPINLYPSFENDPVFIADMQTKNAKDPSNVRWQNKTTKGTEILIHEEQSQNPEMNHNSEAVGYMGFTVGP